MTEKEFNFRGPTLEKNKIQQEALGFIVDIGYDYDGYHSAEDLKSLIDEMVEVAQNALNGIPLPEPIPLDGSGAFDKWIEECRIKGVGKAK